MADWIKVRVALRRNPKVVAIARLLASDTEFRGRFLAVTDRHESSRIVTNEIVTRVTVCALVELWGALNEVLSSECEAPFMTLDDIDEIVGVPSFGRAMASVGWVVESCDKGLQFPNFHEHNTPQAARPQAKTQAERAKEYRDRKAAEARHDSSRGVTQRRGEERREDIKTSTSIADLDADEDFSPIETQDDERQELAKECERVRRIIGSSASDKQRRQDRELIFKAVVLSRRVFGPEFLEDAVKAIEAKMVAGRVANPRSMFHAICDRLADDRGKHFARHLKRVIVPEWVVQRKESASATN